MMPWPDRKTLEMIAQIVLEKTKGGRIEINPPGSGCHILAKGRLGGILYVNVYQPKEFTRDTFQKYVIIPSDVLPSFRPMALFVLNQAGTHGYCLNNEEIPEPDAVDGLIAANLSACKYFDLSIVKKRMEKI